MTSKQFSPWPCYTDEEINAVDRILRSGKVNYWTGTEGRSFEREFAEFAGSEHAIAVMNGTVALDLALHALDIGEGDEVIVTPRSFIASVSCVVNAGAVPVFADVSPDTQNITPQSIRAVLSAKTKAIICVHLAGWPCEMDEIMEIADEKGLHLIEDCAQAHGAKYRGRSVGSFGDVGCWSFCQDKIMTTGGEGGMVTTSNKDLWSRMWSYKDHGKSWRAVYETEHSPGYRWLHESFGTNWRMTEIQAAIGRVQLKCLDEWKALRQAHGCAIESACRKFASLRVPRIPGHIDHAYYRASVFVVRERLAQGWSQDRIVDEFSRRGIPCFQGGCAEIYREKAFDGTMLRPATRMPVASELGETTLSFLVHPTLGQDEIRLICETIEDVLQEATQSERPSER